MKLLTAAFLVACAPSLCLALIQTTWEFDNYPEDGLLDITFPLHISDSSHAQDYLLLYQFTISGTTDSSMIFLQPLEDKDGKSSFNAQFQTYQEGTTTNNANCTVKTGDDVSGVACRVLIDGDYTHPYSLVVENAGGTTWRGTVIDTQDNVATLIGEWTLPSFTGKINAGYEQFANVEYLPWIKNPGHICNTLPQMEVQLFNPTSKTAGASGGNVDSASWTDDCAPEMVHFSSTNVPGGLGIKVGTV